jgi:hypothetical protein
MSSTVHGHKARDGLEIWCGIYFYLLHTAGLVWTDRPTVATLPDPPYADMRYRFHDEKSKIS